LSEKTGLNSDSLSADNVFALSTTVKNEGKKALVGGINDPCKHDDHNECPRLLLGFLYIQTG